MKAKKNFICRQNLIRPQLIAGILLSLISTSSFANSNDLSNVNKEISRQQGQINASKAKLDQLQAALRQQEQAINNIVKRTRETQNRLDNSKRSINELNRQSDALKKQKANQIEQLKALLNSHYRQGKYSDVSNLFNGKDAQQTDRMTVYLKYLSDARTKAIHKLSETDQALKQKQQQLEQQAKQWSALLTELNSDKQKLEGEQRAQQITANAIRRQINNDTAQLSELNENKRRLEIAIQQAEKQAEEARRLAAQKNQPIGKGLNQYKGKLIWPTKGKILQRYGSPQSGQLRWNGMVIAAKEGSEVKATHGGTIVLSSWLRGYGLMIVIDHGQGDMSFYGYNQALLRNVGDTVAAGEAIALVGNSGGQSTASLYFEIRRKGTPTNPQPWLAP